MTATTRKSALREPTRRLLPLGLLAVLGALAACASGEHGASPAPSPASSAAATPDPGVLATEGPLVVNDALSANPALVSVPVQIPKGFALKNQSLCVPAGFSVSVLAAGLKRPRFMAFDDAGALLVACQGDGRVVRYPAENGSVQPKAVPPAPLLTGLDVPSSLAIHAGHLYVGETNRVTRFAYTPGQAAGKSETIIPDLPTGYHSPNTVAFGPDGKLYLSIGSSCNICTESDERRAAISRYNPDGTGYERFAWGLRNAVGLAFQPTTGSLWATCNERDMQGDEIPPDLVTRVTAKANYGWPDCQPPDAKPQSPGAKCEGVTPPTVGIQPHSAPLGLAFSSGTAWPTAYRNSLIVAQHGSWNRQPPAAPKLLQIALDGDRPVAVHDFVTGWQDAQGNRWGRPAGVIVAPDGSLIVSDDDAGLLYRVKGPQASAAIATAVANTTRAIVR